MPSQAESLALFLEKKCTTREWARLVATSAPRIADGEIVDEFAYASLEEGQKLADVADELVLSVHAHAQAYKSAGPFFVWVCRVDESGRALPPTERFAMRFDDCAPSASDERSSMTAIAREGLNDANRSVNEYARTNLEYARLAATKDSESVSRAVAEADRARQDLMNERTHSLRMAEIVFATATTASEALVQGDERRAKLAQARQTEQVIAGLVRQGTVIFPVLASEYMRSRQRERGETPQMPGEQVPRALDAVRRPEVDLLRRFREAVPLDKLPQIAAALPPEIRMGVEAIMGGHVEDSMIPGMVAELMDGLDKDTAFRIVSALGVGDKTDTLNEAQTIFCQLWELRHNTLAAMGARVLEGQMPEANK